MEACPLWSSGVWQGVSNDLFPGVAVLSSVCWRVVGWLFLFLFPFRGSLKRHVALGVGGGMGTGVIETCL